MKTRKQKVTVLKTAFFAAGILFSTSLLTACGSDEEAETTDGDPTVETDSVDLVIDTDTLDEIIDTFTVSEDLIDASVEEVETFEE